jgi:hypothetical protein
VNTFGIILFTLVEAVDEDVDDIDDVNVVQSLVFARRLRVETESKLLILELKVVENEGAKLIILELKVDEAKLNDGASTEPAPSTTRTSALQVFAAASPPIIHFDTSLASSSPTTTFSKTSHSVLVFFLDLDLVLGLALVLRGGVGALWDAAMFPQGR